MKKNKDTSSSTSEALNVSKLATTNERIDKLANTITLTSGNYSYLEDMVKDMYSIKTSLSDSVSTSIYTNRERLALRTDDIIGEALRKLSEYKYFGNLTYLKNEEVPVQEFQTVSSKVFELLCDVWASELKAQYVDMSPILANLSSVDLIINIFTKVYSEVYSDKVSKELLFKFENALCQHFCIDKLN